MLKDKIKFDARYFVKFMVLLVLEITIALYVKDQFVRPYLGDVLVILLMYTCIKSFVALPTKKLPVYLFIFACLIELSQGLKLVEALNLGQYKWAGIILGTSFDVRDILCYALGSFLLVIWEKLLRKNIAYL